MQRGIAVAGLPGKRLELCKLRAAFLVTRDGVGKTGGLRGIVVRGGDQLLLAVFADVQPERFSDAGGKMIQTPERHKQEHRDRERENHTG